MMIAKVLSLAVFLLCSTSTLASAVELESMVMQLRSQVDTQNNELLDKVLSVTTQYMDEYFGAYYANTEPRDYFSHTALTVNSFGIHGVTGSFITTLEIDGALFFNSDPAPSQSFINTLLTNAFQGLNLDLFLETVLSADNEFLAALTHIIIEINDDTVTEENLKESGMINSEEEIPKSGWASNDGAVIAVYAVAGVVGALLIIGVFCIFRCYCCKDNRQVEDDVEPYNLKSIEIPSTVNNRVRRGSRRSGSRSFKKNNTGVFFEARNNDRSPSPVRSFASQDSSKFTYNPTGTSMSKASFSVGSLSAINMDMPSIDIEAWQRQNTISPVTPPPFGHDISAIEQKDRDLSQIEEGHEESMGSRDSDDQYLSRKSLSAMEMRKSRSRKITSRASIQPRGIPENSKRGMEYSLEDSGMDSEQSGDVISDLRDLSLQIDKHRRSRSGR